MEGLKSANDALFILLGAIMDTFDISSSPSGTRVEVRKYLT